MSNFSDERQFIERQLSSFHSFRQELRWYSDNINRVFSMASKSPPLITVSFYTNYRDIIWHYKKFVELEHDETEAHVQYEMMLEYLNRAVIDMFVDLFQKLYYVHTRIAYSCMSNLEQNKVKALFYPHEQAKVEQRLAHSKIGYLKAREALLLLRSRRSSLYRPISAEFDFSDHTDYDSNSVYYHNIIILFIDSCSELAACKD